MSDKNIKTFCTKLKDDEWDSLMMENNTLKAYDFFFDKISTTAKKYFPLKEVKI